MLHTQEKDALLRRIEKLEKERELYNQERDLVLYMDISPRSVNISLLIYVLERDSNRVKFDMTLQERDDLS